MDGPQWVDGLFAVLLALVALLNATRLVAARVGPGQAPPGEGAHLVMALGMIAMFVPPLDMLPRFVWIGVFVVIAAWLGAALLRAGSAGAEVPHRAHQVHLTLSMAAMGFMFATMSTGTEPVTALAAPAGVLLAHDHGGGGPGVVVLSGLLGLYFLTHTIWSGANFVRKPRLTDAGHIVMGLSMSYMFVAMLG